MDYHLADILDLPALQRMFNSLWTASKIPMGVIDAAGETLASVGRQRVCSTFHHKHPDLAKTCLLNRVDRWPGPPCTEGNVQPVEFRCTSGLIDIALPICVEQQRLGILFLGQFHDQLPDQAAVRRQAAAFGFEPETYLEMIDEVPVLSRQMVENYLDFLVSLMRMLCETGLSKLREERVRQQLLETESRFRLIFEKSAVGIVTLGEDCRIRQANPQFCRFIGYAEAELQALTVLDITAPQDREATSRLLDEHTGKIDVLIDTEKRYQRKDGTVVWGRVIANSLDPAVYPGIVSIAMVQDISRRKLMEQALQESELSFRSVIDAIPMGFNKFVLEGDDRLIFNGYNPAADQILGIDSSVLLGKEILEAFPGLRDSELPQRYREVCRTGRPWHEPQFAYQDGATRGVFEIHAFRIGPDRMACLFTDITERIIAQEKLRSSETTLQGLLAAAPLNIGLTRDRTFRWVNRWMTDLVGYREEELIGHSARMLYETDAEFERVGREKYPAVIQGGMGEVQTRWRCKNGRVIDVLLRSKLIDRDNPAAGVIFTGLDITELKKTVEELRSKEQEVRLLLESSGEAIYGIDRDGNCMFVNPTCLELLGYDDDDELLGRNSHALIHHTRADGTACPEAECRIYQAFRQGSAVHAVGELFWRRDRSSFPVEYWSHPMFRDGELVGTVVNFIDITERKRTEDELLLALTMTQTARAQVDAILRSAADGMIVVNLDGRIIMVNAAAEQLLARTHAELDGRLLLEVLPDPVLLERVAITLAGDEQTDPLDLAPWMAADGCNRIMAARVAMMSTPAGAAGAIITLRDVTRERELDKLKDEFISIAAHELRTPLTSILGYTELMLDQLPQLESGKLREFLGIVYERANTLATIIGDMLDLSRVQSGRLISLDLTIGDLSALLRQAVLPYRIDTSRHSFVVQTGQSLPLLIFDPNKLAQVLDNLLSNAVKFSPSGGTIRLSAVGRADDVLVSVSDEGVGMNPEQVTRIFDKFFRVDSSNTAVSGLGLGMTLVKGIIEAHGGRIWVESGPGAGTTVLFTLPLRHHG